MARATAAFATLSVFVYALHLSASASMKKDLSRATANKTLELVQALQQDLRHDNDDYKDARAGVAGLRNPYLGGAPPGREQGNARGPAPPPTADGRPPSAPTFATTGGSDGATKAAPVSVPAPARRSNDKSKLHQLLDQEGLLAKFLRGLPHAGKQRHIEWQHARARDEGGGGGGEAGGGETRPRAFDSKEYFRPTPDTVPEAELDMLAATGEHIANLKRRGRFCYRHILFPEGPKYDSRGKVYLKEHELSVNFSNTRRPKLLLPRCCNCCKKSVLGCE